MKEGYKKISDLDAVTIKYHERSNDECPCDYDGCSCHCCGFCVLPLIMIGCIIFMVQSVNIINAINEGALGMDVTTWITVNGNCKIKTGFFASDHENVNIIYGTECSEFKKIFKARIIINAISLGCCLFGMIGIYNMKPLLAMITILVPLGDVVIQMIILAGLWKIQKYLTVGIISIILDVAMAYLFHENYKLVYPYFILYFNYVFM